MSEKEKDRAQISATITVPGQGGTTANIHLHSGLTIGEHQFVHVNQETIAILAKWDLDIDTLVKAADTFLASVQFQPTNPTNESTPQRERIRLSDHRRTLIAFMESQSGPVARADILNNTKIPAGSLSALLRTRGFFQTEHGLWAFKELEEEPGTSAPPAK